MYMNLHTLPPGEALYTLYVSRPNETDFDEVEFIGPRHAPGVHCLTSVIVHQAKDDLVRAYGRNVEVRAVIDQSSGEIVFASGWRGYRPLPVLPGPNLALVAEGPYGAYDTLISLFQDANAGLGTEEYRDRLLER